MKFLDFISFNDRKQESWRLPVEELIAQIWILRTPFFGISFTKKCDMWHMTCNTWHVTCDMLWGVNILSKLQLPSSYGLGFMIFFLRGSKIAPQKKVVGELAGGGSMALAFCVSDMWQVTCDMWHVTHDIWHMTHDFLFFIFSVLLSLKVQDI